MGGPAFNITTETVTAANVGIGTASPGQKLDVRGNAYVQDVIYLGRKDVEKHFIIRNINTSVPDSTAWAISLRTDIGGPNNNLKFTRFDETGGYVDIPMVIEQSSGNVGIGTPTPSAKLDVNGLIRSYVTDGSGNRLDIADTNDTPGGTELRLKRSLNYFDLRYDAGGFKIEYNDSPLVAILTGGNVGIGPAALSPAERLEVDREREGHGKSERVRAGRH